MGVMDRHPDFEPRFSGQLEDAAHGFLSASSVLLTRLPRPYGRRQNELPATKVSSVRSVQGGFAEE